MKKEFFIHAALGATEAHRQSEMSTEVVNPIAQPGYAQPGYAPGEWAPGGHGKLEPQQTQTIIAINVSDPRTIPGGAQGGLQYAACTNFVAVAFSGLSILFAIISCALPWVSFGSTSFQVYTVRVGWGVRLL